MKIILVSGAVALGIAAIISTITYQTGLQNQMAEDKSIADVFVEDEEVYVIWDIPYINLQLKVRHKYVLQKQGEEKMVRIPGDNARYDPISHRILYSQKGSLYSCSLTMKDRKLLLQVPKANGLRLQSSGKYIVASGQTVQNVKGGESVTPIGHYWLLNLDDEEVKELSFFEEEGSYLIAANDKNLVFSYMEMASYDHTENRLIRYNLETDESQIITDQLERECVNPGYISEGFLYFVSDNRVNRIKLDGGSIESVNVPYDEFGIHKAVCIAGSEEIYIICDDSTSYTAPEHIVVVRWDAVPQIVYKESISNFLKVVHV